MSETTAATGTESTPTPKAVAEAAPQGKERDETPEQTIEALRAALAKANAEAKDNRLKASEFDKLQQERMTELERAQAQAQAAQQSAEKAAAEALRWRIAAKHGISDEDAETFLLGTDEETLTRQAQRLAAMNAASAAPTTPKPDRTQGGSGATVALNGDGLEQALKDKLGIA